MNEEKGYSAVLAEVRTAFGDFREDIELEDDPQSDSLQAGLAHREECCAKVYAHYLSVSTDS